jgi:glycosyltransferase involved in cell wall biosynthesis
MDLDALDAVPPTDVRHELGLRTDATLLCSVGRLVHDKGHVYLVRAMKPLRDRWPNLHLVLVGEGPEDSRIVTEAEEHDLGDRVHLLGFRSDVVGIMKGTDVFCLPSLEEGMPVTVLEAMACTRPVIAADVGGVANLITSGETGIIVPPAELWTTMDEAGGPNGSARSGDGRERTRTTSRAGIEALTRAIDTMMSDARERDRLARAGRRFIEEHYTLDRVLTLLEEHYGAVATNGHAAANGTRT